MMNIGYKLRIRYVMIDNNANYEVFTPSIDLC